MDTIDFEYKDEALNIINDIPVEKGREAKLMQLRGGVPYRYMLKYIFPSLRVAICKVNYEIKNFNLDEAKEIIKTRPQNLSLNEMFMVANSYPKVLRNSSMCSRLRSGCIRRMRSPVLMLPLLLFRVMTWYLRNAI